MKILILVLAVLLVQEALAWDMKHWGDWWWKQETASPEKSKHHHKHHKHYRHHHHHPQTCVPMPTSCATTTAPPGKPSVIPITDIDPFFPYNIGGKLTDAGVNCSDSLTSQVV